MMAPVHAPGQTLRSGNALLEREGLVDTIAGADLALVGTRGQHDGAARRTCVDEESALAGLTLPRLTVLQGLQSVVAARGPVSRLAAEVLHAADTLDLQPISACYVANELAPLASAFNQLLRSVSRMREQQACLVADVGHELRTPLTSLTTNVDLLSADLNANRLPVAQKSAILSDVRAQLCELTELVGDLVSLSRGDSAGSFRPLDLRDAVTSAVQRVRRRAGDRVFDVKLAAFYMVGDPEGLERMITNLLDNAVKWSPAGSTIRVHLHGNRLRVADSGPGILDADMPYVFDRFFRGETARKTHGTGLGLSIVAKTVEDHGGSVKAGRSSDDGAEFTVQLPGVTSREALPSGPGTAAWQSA